MGYDQRAFPKFGESGNVIVIVIYIPHITALFVTPQQ